MHRLIAWARRDRRADHRAVFAAFAAAVERVIGPAATARRRVRRFEEAG